MIRHAYLALAQRLDAKSPTDRVQADPQRMQQWLDRLLLAGSLAGRRGPQHAETRAAVAEADRYSGRPRSPAPISATLASASPRGLL